MTAFPIKCEPTALATGMVELLLALAIIHSQSRIQGLECRGDCVTVRCEDFMVEVAWARDSMTSARLVKAKRDSIERSKKEKLLPQTVAVLVLAYGHTGPLPGSKMPESIIDEVATDHVIDGPLTLGDRWLRSQDLASVKDVVELRTLLGIRNITKESA